VIAAASPFPARPVTLGDGLVTTPVDPKCLILLAFLVVPAGVEPAGGLKKGRDNR
jgi:hypothetical protein